MATTQVEVARITEQLAEQRRMVKSPEARRLTEDRAMYLREQGWTQKDVAALLGVNQATISRWQRRHYREHYD